MQAACVREMAYLCCCVDIGWQWLIGKRALERPRALVERQCLKGNTLPPFVNIGLPRQRSRYKSGSSSVQSVQRYSFELSSAVLCALLWTKTSQA